MRGFVGTSNEGVLLRFFFVGPPPGGGGGVFQAGKLDFLSTGDRVGEESWLST